MSRTKAGFAGTIVAVVSLGACSGTGAPSVPIGAGSPVTATVFSVGYDRIAEVYLEPVDMGKLTVDGLAGLSSIDPRLGARRNGSVVEMTVDGETFETFRAIDSRDSAGWAALTTAALARARQVSPALEDASAEDIYEAVFSALAKDLDPYSRYLSAERAGDDRAFRDGYGGIGLLLEQDEAGRPFIKEVFEEGPAFRAGVKAGSVILAVDGTPVGSIRVDDLGNRLRGTVDSYVQLTVAPSSGGETTFDLKRERVVPKTVKVRFNDDVAIIELSRFNSATAQQAASALRQAVRTLGPAAKGIVLDLRGNPGGLLSQSVKVADMFIAHGQIISTRGRHPDSFQYFNAESDDLTNGLPVVVLVDGQSASGAEVLAAALQDSGRAVIVGASSYGKGSVQQVIRLPNDGELFLTWSRIYSPAGYTLHQQGVMPTVCTSGTITDAALLIAQFRSGALPVPASMLADRRAAPDDVSALEHLRSSCPWLEHDGNFDIEVAEMLLEDRQLFAQALALTTAPTVVSAERLDTAN